MDHSINNPDQVNLGMIRAACAYLFSPQQARDKMFVNRLTHDSVKKAFRRKAKMYHPDFHDHESGDMILKRQDRFVKVRQSYELLKATLPKSENPSPPQPVKTKPENRPKKIIAVGGAKGGIGKSVFAANLGVLLSGMGHKTIVVDMDLGGANLHLYLGETRVRHSINDFMDKKAASLESIMFQTKYGPWLIGGDSSRLGAANISFSRKIKLIRALRGLDADFVIMDLGGETSYNVMDFFLASDFGLVLTTCDPASYLEAYNFIKVGLYRKLSRMHGPENSKPIKRDEALEALIQNAVMSSSSGGVKNIKALQGLVAEKMPSRLHLVESAVSNFSPRLVVNRKTLACNPHTVVQRIVKVSKNMLSIDVSFLGTLPQEAGVEKSVRELTPSVWKDSTGPFAQSLHSIYNNI